MVRNQDCIHITILEHLQPTFDADLAGALLLADGVGSDGGVLPRVGVPNLVDGDLVAAVRGKVAVHHHAGVLLQLCPVLHAVMKWMSQLDNHHVLNIME